MKQLLVDKKFYCQGAGKHLFIVQPPLTQGDQDAIDYKLDDSQGFNWYPNSVFFPFRYGLGWLTIYQSDRAEFNKKSTRAIILPFEVPEEEYLTFGGDFDDAVRIELPPGKYKLLYELRTLTIDEVLDNKKYQYASNYSAETVLGDRAPELCTVTFIPTEEEVKPELLKFSSWRSSFRGESPPAKKLVMFKYPIEEPY